MTENQVTLDPVGWQQANDRYLSASLRWLRTLLRRGERPEPLEQKPRRWLDAFVPIRSRAKEAGQGGDAGVTGDLVADQRLRAAAAARRVGAEPFTAVTDALTFRLRNAPEGRRRLRLRVDGVDSPLVDRSVTPPVFDDDQAVILT